ncbi:unnamed protein product [Clonostachys rosea]|uniref:SCP domain-containing protein n=1 Tax=Bionectria ochroleuca TaxID=29856 RepID=A0ABY6TW12_BIOOC|nr:unnamed protein product [Clonostachys rosea]
MYISSILSSTLLLLSLQCVAASPTPASEATFACKPEFFTRSLIEKRALTTDESQALQLHNDARAAVGVPALEWDTDLQANALAWAQELARRGSLDHSDSSQRPNQGENLAGGSMYFCSISGLKMNYRTDEKDSYHNEIILEGDFGSYGHYTQVVWSTTTRVGIAWASNGKGGFYTVARYSPPGNWVGERPY